MDQIFNRSIQQGGIKVSYCIILRENKNSRLYGPYNSLPHALSTCETFVETTSGALVTEQEYCDLTEFKEADFVIRGCTGEYSLQIAELKSRLILPSD